MIRPVKGLALALALWPLASSPSHAEEWTESFTARLPDSAFASVESDSRGRKVRHLPHHDETGAVDIPHLRSALARWHQVKWLDPAHAEPARAHLEAHWREYLATQAGTPGPPGPGSRDDQTFAVYRHAHPPLSYSFEYPATWEVENQEHERWQVRSLGSGRISIRNPVADLSRPSGPVHAVLLVEALPDMSVGLEQYARIYQQMTRLDNRDYQEERTEVVTSAEGERFLLEEQFEVYGVRVHRLNLFVPYRAVVFQLSATAASVVWDRYRPLFERFVRSFHVTSPEGP